MSMVKIMTEAMSVVKLSVLGVLNEKNDWENEKMTEASALVCLMLATAPKFVRGFGLGYYKRGGLCIQGAYKCMK